MLSGHGSAGVIDYIPDRELSFWPSPPEVAFDLVYQALMPCHLPFGEGVRVLEPSAGAGHLAAAVRAQLPHAHITCVEPSPARAERLRSLDGVADEVVESTLEDYLATTVPFAAMAGTFEPFHLVVMNPPFTLPGRRVAWAEHILALHDDPYVVAPAGVISAVVPHTVITGKAPLVRKVRQLAVQMDACERGAFDPVGAQVATARILIDPAATREAGRG